MRYLIALLLLIPVSVLASECDIAVAVARARIEAQAQAVSNAKAAEAMAKADKALTELRTEIDLVTIEQKQWHEGYWWKRMPAWNWRKKRLERKWHYYVSGISGGSGVWLVYDPDRPPGENQSTLYIGPYQYQKIETQTYQAPAQYEMQYQSTPMYQYSMPMQYQPMQMYSAPRRTIFRGGACSS